jgi:phage terminase large subunit-like protein
MSPARWKALAQRLARIDDDEELRRLLGLMSVSEALEFDACFEAWAHEGQEPPRSDGWRTWLMMAGRGYGKTRAGAEWINALATQKGRPVRIALVGATASEVRQVMVEGESGILASARNGKRPSWEPSLGRLRWPGGSEAFVYSGENPDGLRGGNHHYAWCDELAKWARPEETWDNLQMSLRCGTRPRALVTTTPRAMKLLARIRKEPWTVETSGTTGDNAHLPPEFLKVMAATYGGTRLGRQELDGELIEEAAGSLWPRAMIEGARTAAAAPGRGPKFDRVVVGVDPPASVGGDACGIVVCGLARDGTGHVLEDASVEGMRPEGWAAAVAAAAARWNADRVVAEGNQGGAMVESVLRAARAAMPVRLVNASKGKSARAEPVAALFENGRAKFAGTFPGLEDELSGLTIGGGYEGPGRSPDRADACVWAMTELMLRKERGEPRVVAL